MFKQHFSDSATKFSRSVTVLTLGGALAFTGILGAIPAHAASGDIVSASEAQKDTWRQELLTKINSYRATKGLKPFKYSDTISNIAQDEANKNVRAESISHSGNFANDPRKGNIMGGSEISAWNSQLSTTLIVDGWRGSPGHNAILLSPTIDVVGFGVTHVDGKLAGSGAPWKLVGVMDGYDYFPGDEPSDTRTSVPISGTSVVAPQPSGTSVTLNGIRVDGAVYAKFKKDGGTAVFGNPTIPKKSDGKGGYYQDFQKGTVKNTIYWTSQYGAQVVNTSGDIGAKWNKSGRRAGLGVPAGPKMATSSSGYYQVFKNGSTTNKVMWSGSTGARNVKETGSIGAKWKAAGSERGYGYPTIDETRTSSGTIYQKFKKGTRTTTIYWASGKGTWVR